MQSFFAAIVSMLIGLLVALVTLFSLINMQINSAADNTANVDQPSIDYGTTR